MFTFMLRLHITKNSHNLIQVQNSQYYIETPLRGGMNVYVHITTVGSFFVLLFFCASVSGYGCLYMCVWNCV